MKNRLKRVLAVLVAICLLTLSSCATIRTYVDDYQSLDGSIIPDKGFRITANLEYEFEEQITEQIEERFEKMEELLEANNVVRALPFLLLFEKQVQDMFYVSDHATLCNIRYYANPQDEAAMNEYIRLSELYTDYSSRLLAMYRPIYESNYKYVFFGALSKAETQRILALADSFTGEVATLSKDRNDLIAEYRQLSMDSTEFNEKSAELYRQIVKKNNEIAVLSGYESYPEYAYDVVYSRDYTPEDARQMHTYVKEYIVPLANELNRELKDYAKNDPWGAKKLEEESNAIFNRVLDPITSNGEFGEYYSLQYYDADAFIDTWENHSVFGNADSYPVAFTTYLRYYDFPICYFGEGYQMRSTYIHEQGHFASFLDTVGGYSSMDLNEVHSQGNEWLYYSYLSDNCVDSGMYELIVKSLALEHCLNIIVSTACDMFEQRVYENADLSASEYDGVFNECVSKLGAAVLLEDNMTMNPSDYWHIAIVANSMYYLSYAVSLIPSIELYVIAEEEGLEEAAERYIALTEGDSEIEFQKALKKADLCSPFDEEVYTKLKAFFVK